MYFVVDQQRRVWKWCLEIISEGNQMLVCKDMLIQDKDRSKITRTTTIEDIYKKFKYSEKVKNRILHQQAQSHPENSHDVRNQNHSLHNRS